MNPVTVDIFCAFPIFAPSKNLFDRNKDSVLSFIDYIKANPYYLTGERGFKLHISYGGWAKDQIWFDDLKETIKQNIPEAKVYQFDKNYGKSKVVNSLAFDYAKDNPGTNFMLTTDSDMLFQNDQVLFFDRLYMAANVIQQKSQEFFGSSKPFGFLAVGQLGENCHWYEPRPGYTGLNRGVAYEVKGDNGLSIKENIVWADDGCGVAGGGIFCNFKIWQQLGGYRNFNTSYNGDDALICRDMLQCGASVTVIKSLSLVHPTPNDDPEYRKWKDECLKTAFHDYDSKKFDESVKDFEKVIGNV